MSRGGLVKFPSRLLLAGVSSFIFITSNVGQAADVRSFSSQAAFTDYYRVNEAPTTNIPIEDQLFSLDNGLFKLLKEASIHLLKVTYFAEPYPAPSEKYDRRMHYGRWINDPSDDTCQNTRAKVLVRDSVGPVTFRNDKQCVVDTGAWEDQYTGLTLNNARQVQVDHMVPLKHSWLTGASNWDFKARCLYANFMGNNHHLIPVYAHENMSKGDRGPDKYMPPNQNITCDYVKTWLKVKLAWRLVIPSEEMIAIQQVIADNNCDTKNFSITVEELNETRRFMNENLDYCVKNRRQ